MHLFGVFQNVGQGLQVLVGYEMEEEWFSQIDNLGAQNVQRSSRF